MKTDGIILKKSGIYWRIILAPRRILRKIPDFYINEEQLIEKNYSTKRFCKIIAHSISSLAMC
jgi:hypothetical protein